MSEKEKNKRREFLNHVCPAVAMAFLGVPAIQSCSSGDDDTDMGTVSYTHLTLPTKA